MKNNFSKQYSTKNIQFQYSLASKKWQFDITKINHTLLYPCVGGVAVARKVAAAIEGGLTRSNQIDALARGQIKHLTGF